MYFFNGVFNNIHHNYPLLLQTSNSFLRRGQMRMATTKRSRMLLKITRPSKKISLYKRLPVPGTKQFVTIKTSDLRQMVDIYFNGKKSTLRMTDIMKIRTLPDVIRVLQKA